MTLGLEVRKLITITYNKETYKITFIISHMEMWIIHDVILLYNRSILTYSHVIQVITILHVIKDHLLTGVEGTSLTISTSAVLAVE